MVSSAAIAAWLGAHDVDPDEASRRRRRDDPRFRPAMRACLGPRCLGRVRFLSSHAGHRICPDCRELLHRRYGVLFGDAGNAPE